jgi:ankyrin repeat protein
MQSEDERCREAKRFERIHAAFKAGDIEALRAAVDDPSAIPNGQMPMTIGPCLTYAIHWSPVAFIRQLLELGADPNHDDGDGFPPLIAAIGKTTPVRGSWARPDVNEVIELLLAHGADPNQRGVNDYTALHAAVEHKNLRAVELLLASGADPSLKTRIDDCETAGQMARRYGPIAIADRLDQEIRKKTSS